MEKLDRIAVGCCAHEWRAMYPRDLGLTVRRVLKALALYPERKELKREHPELEEEDIRQVLAFAAALVDDKVVQLPQAR